MASKIQPRWYATLRYVANRVENATTSDDRVTDADLDLRIARALERRGLLTTSQFGNWYLTAAGTEIIGGDYRATPDQTEIDLLHTMADILDEMGITTVDAYNKLSADCADMIHGAAANLAGQWTACVRNNAEHIAHNEAIGDDCLTPAYGYDGMGGFVHTDGETYLHDPATSTYKAYDEMEVGDRIAWAGKPEIEIISIRSTTATDLLGRVFPAHIGRRVDTGAEGSIPFGPGGKDPVKNRTDAADGFIHLSHRYSAKPTVCEIPDEDVATTERLNDATCPRCSYLGDPVDRTANLLIEDARAEAAQIDKGYSAGRDLAWRERVYRRAVERNAAAPHMGEAADILLGEAYEEAMASRPATRRPAAPASARPGNLTYEVDGGDHVWRLEGSDYRITTADGPVDAGAAQQWAARVIAAGGVPGIPAGTRVAGWRRATDDGAEWMVPDLSPDRDPDRDSAPDRDQPAKITPLTIRHQIRRKSRSAEARPGTVLAGTGTARTETTGTDDPDRGVVYYLVETETETGWVDVQSGTTPPLYPVPVLDNLDTVADTIKGNVSYVLGRGPAAPDRPVRISTWVNDLPTAAYIYFGPPLRDRAGRDSSEGNRPS